MSMVSTLNDSRAISISIHFRFASQRLKDTRKDNNNNDKIIKKESFDVDARYGCANSAHILTCIAGSSH